MKILHMASGDLWAGAEVQLYHLARELAASSQVDLMIVLLNDGQLANALRAIGVQVIILDESSLSGLSILIHLYRLVLKFKPDVIHTHRSKENVIGGLVAFITRTASVRTAHGANEFADQKFNLRRAAFSLLDKISGWFFQRSIIAVSPELVGKLKTTYPHRKITVIPNGINVASVIEKSNLPVEFERCAEHFNIAFVGRFVPVKRPDIFLRIAINTLNRSQQQNIHFYMFGDGPLCADANRTILENGYQHRIHTPGFVSNIAPYLKAMDVLLFTSDHEGLPMTLLEAMALHVTVVSRDLPTIKQVLCDGECGYVLTSDQPEDFSRLITRLYNNKNELRIKTAMAYENLQARYSIQEIAQSYVALYRKVSA
ncbi:MAG: glycosyltransferase [Gammaproteobacteria bacterium]|nr:glycosyltransferase [Gammaproteobacteria bacterium]